MNLKPNFKPVHLLEWLITVVKDNYKDVKKLGFNCAIQMPCSLRCGPDRYVWIEELFDLLGVKLVERKYDAEIRSAAVLLPVWAAAHPRISRKTSVSPRKSGQEHHGCQTFRRGSHDVRLSVLLCGLAKDDKAAEIMPLMAPISSEWPL
jgi:hypothetical protein